MESFIGWIGGKRALRKVILSHFPASQPARYVEVFGGAGWVLFAKDVVPSQLEVYNDVNRDLVNLFRCIKYHSDELQRELLSLPTSRELFFDFRAQLRAQGLTDIQRAARFFYVVKCSFGSDARSFTTSKKGIGHTINRFHDITERLKHVTIENRDFQPLIKTYDRPDTLFYLDPPYVGAEAEYDAPFSEADHLRLRDQLKSIRGKFILSYNDTPFIRDLYQDFYIEAVERSETLSGVGKNKGSYKEIIVKNFN